MHHVHKISYFILVPSVLVLGLLLVSYHQKYNEIRQDPEKYTQESIQELITEVSQLITLPSNETPTVATVADPEKLKGQQFFDQAKVGDRVLIYIQAKKAILYDPVAKKIVEVAPLFVQDTAVNTQTDKNVKLTE